MKKIFCAAFCTLFFAACLLFAAGAFPGGDDTASEGRELAAFPSLKTEEGGFNAAFFTEFDAWLTDHFSLRRTLITLDSRVKASLFATGSDQVIVGRDDFLFLADTAADFTGESAMTDAEITAAADALAALSARAADYGARLIVAVAPNKNTVYPEKMPAVYRRSNSPSNTDRLHAALEQRGILYTDLAAVLEDAETLLYHRRDTHWNGAGALAAYNAVMDTAGIAHENYETYPLITTDDFRGDLDELLYPSAELYDENILPEFDFASRFIYTSNYLTPMDMIITTRGKGEGKLLIFRDSFGSALIPYFSAAYGEVRYERATPYRIDILKQFNADLVVVEIAERNLPKLSEYIAVNP